MGIAEADLERLKVSLADAFATVDDGEVWAGPNAVVALAGDEPPLVLDGFKPWRDSIIWPFNRLFWQQLGDWEAYAKRGFEVRRHELLDTGAEYLDDDVAIVESGAVHLSE